MTAPWTPELRRRAAHTLRGLAIDATNAAQSGHPGAPMGLADVAVILFGEVMRYDPRDPDWPDRDRFVLSNGHASMLLYGVLHLTGYDLSLDEIRRFRQLGSRTPGHPERGQAPGVETTTGPLGQGFANAVGMAIGARLSAARFNGRDFDPITHAVYGVVGDGCLMEGISYEAAALAGHLGLGELVFVFDDNGITIDGATELATSEDVEARFEAAGWHTIRIDGHDPDAIRGALQAGRAERARPTLILAKTHIGWGSPNRQDTAKAHGEPLGSEEAELTKQRMDWPDTPFFVPEDVREAFASAGRAGTSANAAWREQLAAWRSRHPDLAASWDAHFDPAPPSDAQIDALASEVDGRDDATRTLSGVVLDALAKLDPRLVGGSADLTGSNKAVVKGSPPITRDDFGGRNVHFGIREHAMAAVGNGLALYGGYVPFVATFLIFSDYMRPSVRLAALMRVRSVFVYTHDSIGLGEDGPTHQPVEQLASLRLIPGLSVWRPADGVETAMAWAWAAERGPEAPHALVLTRQKVPALSRPAGFERPDVWKGGYVLRERDDAEATLIATGSEVAIALDAAERLAERGLGLRVVSMPCLERFVEQPADYQAYVLGQPGRSGPRISLEAGRSPLWKTITGLDGLEIGLDRFGESAPYRDLYRHFGLDAESVADRIATFLASR